MASPRSIRVGLLMCGSLNAAYEANHGGYGYEKLLRDYWESTRPEGCNIHLIIDSYDVQKLKFPDQKMIDDYDIFTISGSG